MRSTAPEVPIVERAQMDDAVFDDLSVKRLERMAAAGAEVIECLRVLAKVNLNVVGEVLREQGTFYEWDHYPKGDVYDSESHAQYYYHAHRSELGEHGHFHTFLRTKGMPGALAPVAYSGETEWPKGDDVLSHIIAIPMDKFGYPTDLFTTNRWVTGENWFAAADVIAMIDHFAIDHASPSWPTNRWITAMVALFRPQIELLLGQRDVALDAWRAKHPDGDAFEDREFEIASHLPISIDRQIELIDAALARR